MNKTAAEARELVAAMLNPLREIAGVEKVLCPPSTAIPVVASALAGTDIGLGAQNMHWEEKGAFTGELAPNMVKEFCAYVIIGHSERRAYFGELSEPQAHIARETGVAFLACGHHATERYGAPALGEHLAERFGLAHRFIEIDNPA